MGGYRAAEHRQTKWATLFRSGTTANLDDAGVAQIRSLGLAAVDDLRDNEERHDPRYELLSTVDRALYLPLLRADPDYLDIAFQEIARVHGSIDSYMEDRLGVGRQEAQRLREVLLQ